MSHNHTYTSIMTFIFIAHLRYVKHKIISDSPQNVIKLCLKSTFIEDFIPIKGKAIRLIKRDKLF